MKELNDEGIYPSGTRRLDENSLLFIFDSDLTEEQESLLNLICDAHDPNVWIDRYYEFAPDAGDPTSMDYDLLPLYKKRIHDKGQLIRNEHYLNYDQNTEDYQTLCISEDFNHIYDPNLKLIRRTINTIKWYYASGEVGATKTMNKFYTLEDAIAHEEQVRKRVLDTAKLVIWANLGPINSFTLLTSLEKEIDLYEKGFKTPLVSWWQNTTDPMVNEIFRQTILHIINI